MPEQGRRGPDGADAERNATTADQAADVGQRAHGQAPLHHHVLQLQHAAGNQATALAVQRRAPWTGNVSLLDDELRAFITSRTRVLELLAAMTPAEKRTVLASFRSRLADVLSFSQMLQAVTILGADLPSALGMLQDASIMTVAIGYGEIQPLILRAPAPQRLALATPRWQTFFTTVCNNRTIVTAVNDLGFTLVTKLSWVKDEASALFSLDLATLKPMLTAATPADRAAVATPAWLPFWRDVCTNTTMAELVDVLFPANLTTKLQWMVAEGTTWPLVRGRLTLASPAERSALLADPAIRTLLSPVLATRELAEALHLLGGTLAQRLPILAAKEGWTAMKIGIELTPAPDRAAVYADPAMKALFVAQCTLPQLLEAVTLLGGTLSQRLDWLVAKNLDAVLVLPLVLAAPEAERLALHADPAFTAWLRAQPDLTFGLIARALGGTPTQQLALFAPARPLSLLTWATPSQEWVDAIKAVRPNPSEFLALAGANLAWAPFLRPRLAEWFRGRTETVVGADAVNLVWAAYGDGATFVSADTLVVFRALYSIGLAPAGTDKIFPKGSNAAGAALRERYQVVAPSDVAARGFMQAVRPIPRSQVALAPIVFSDKYWDETQAGTTWSGPEKALTTSFYWQGTTVIHAKPGGEMNTAIINRDSAGTGTAFGGGSTVPAGMSPLTYFQNHVRHEVGHAVGERRIGTMTTTGNAFATAYAGWAASSQASFLAAMWSAVAEPLTGWPSLDFGSGPVVVTDAQVQAWLVGILATKSEVAGPVKNGADALRDKLATITGSIWGSQELVKYLNAVGGGNSPTSIQDSAYQFTGYTPGTPVHIYSTRFDDQFATYSKAAYTALHTSTGWYSLSSPPETFAEVYTRKYSGAGVPAEVNGKNWTTFFDELELQEDPMFGAPPPTARTPAGIAPPPGP